MLLNPRFAVPGAQPGEAKEWTLTTVVAAQHIAGFGSKPPEAWEDFERWYPLHGSFSDVPAVLGFFDAGAQGYEAFESGWRNDGYLGSFQNAQLVALPFAASAGAAAEDCELGWSNAPFLATWEALASVAAAFGGAAAEAFEAGWRSNESYLRMWNEVVEATALFLQATEPVETFESAWTPSHTQ